MWCHRLLKCYVVLQPYIRNYTVLNFREKTQEIYKHMMMSKLEKLWDDKSKFRQIHTKQNKCKNKKSSYPKTLYLKSNDSASLRWLWISSVKEKWCLVVWLRRFEKCKFSRSVFLVWHPAELMFVGAWEGPAQCSGTLKLNNKILDSLCRYTMFCSLSDTLIGPQTNWSSKQTFSKIFNSPYWLFLFYCENSWILWNRMWVCIQSLELLSLVEHLFRKQMKGITYIKHLRKVSNLHLP